MSCASGLPMPARPPTAHCSTEWSSTVESPGHAEHRQAGCRLSRLTTHPRAVLLGGGARPAEEILSWQSEMTAARLSATVRMILKITRTDIIRSQRKRVARIKASTNDVIRDRGAAGIPGFRINARWLRDFLAYDPRPGLAARSGRLRRPRYLAVRKSGPRKYQARGQKSGEEEGDVYGSREVDVVHSG